MRLNKNGIPQRYWRSTNTCNENVSLTGYITDFIYRSICQNCYFECISVIYSLSVTAHAHACVPIPMLQACVMQLDVLICFS